MGRLTRQSGGPFYLGKREKLQVSAETYLLKQSPRHHHALDLVRPLVDLGVVRLSIALPGHLFVITGLTASFNDH
jgi:hypothetical protein